MERLLLDIQRLVNEHEEKVIRDVLRQMFGRDAVISDARKLRKIYEPCETLNYYLEYSGIILGKITFDFGKTCAVNFTPHQDYKWLDTNKDYTKTENEK